MMNKFVLRFAAIASLTTVIFMWSCSGKNTTEISNETNLIVKKIEKENVVMGSAVGSAGITPEQYENFEELKKNASKEELLLLTNHPNGVVKCYSFWALALDKNADLFSIVKKHINDDTPVETQFGCIKSTEKVGDFFIDLVNPKYENSEIKKLSQAEFNQLDSLLIYKKNNLYAGYDAIENAVPTEYLYPKVRNLVIKNHNQSALVTLSKYKNPNDIELILKNKAKDENPESGYYSTYQAIQNFPDLRFIPFLEKNLYQTLDNDHFSGEWLELYTAIASYKNQKAVELLKVPFTKVQHQNIKEYHIKFVYEAILANRCTLYNDLLWNIWKNEHIITLEGFEYLLNVNAGKVLELSKKELLPAYQIKTEKIVPKITKSIFSENLEETMLNFILLNDKEVAYNIIKYKITSAPVNDFEMYCEKTASLKNPYFNDALFKRLKSADNPYIYLPIVETLISFKDKSINNKILEMRKKNKNMNEEWGSDSLDEILKKNNIK
ncbi:hypothetical protein [Flavobacterium sp. Root420]|uniref:hypothetical protein n=1 Tax=Flavobacterium sp. Root420 TaxID=1736533 RepID=UPI00103F4861|nr:hypothetical protein [Flavobacterium sp. Root420]